MTMMARLIASFFIVEKITCVDNKNTYKFDDCDIYSDIAKKDWVMVIDEDNAVKVDDSTDSPVVAGPAGNEVTPFIIYSYSIDKDGKMTITAPTASTVRFADDAVVFYYFGTEFKVATSATVNGWAAYATGDIGGELYANETNGFMYTRVGFLTMTFAPSDNDTLYGYITQKPQLVKNDSDYYYQISVWNGTETKIFNVEGTGLVNSLDCYEQ